MKQENRNEVLYTKMDEIFGPSDCLSPYGLSDKWRIVEYKTGRYDGNMLSSIGGEPGELSFDPGLKGWYRISLALPGSGWHDFRCSNILHMKLTSDEAYHRIDAVERAYNKMEEFTWRCADMTGQALFLAKKMCPEYGCSLLAGIRFTPMSDQEVEAWKREEDRQDTKRIYATDDMHHLLYATKVTSYEDWLPLVLHYHHSDVEWLSVEQIRIFISNRLPSENIDGFAFPRIGDKNVQTTFPKVDYDRVLKDVVDLGHKKGIKMSVSLRMGAWGMCFPYDQYYFDGDFMADHPELSTYDRNGDLVTSVSYAYAQTQEYMLNELCNAARSGADAVTLIAHRGIPYVLYEKPVADQFYEKYGEYPYELPLDEPRLNGLHCEIMMGFFQRARDMLDREFGKGKIEIHLRSLFSIQNNKAIGIDVEELVRKGLLDAIIVYPQRFYEKLDGDIWQEGKDYRIDLSKYTQRVHTGVPMTVHQNDFDFVGPYINYRGESCGPETMKENISQWMNLEKEFGTKIYFDILPRDMDNEEFIDRAQQLYEGGAERISLWDTYSRVTQRAMWNTAGKLGHKEELADLRKESDCHYSRFPIYQLGRFDISRYNPNWGG